MVRQYARALIGILVMPAVLAWQVPLPLLTKEMLTGPLRVVFLYPLMFSLFYINYASAFTFLYWSALRSPGEEVEITLPAAARGEDRRSFSAHVQPSTWIWVGLPTVLLTFVLLGANIRNPAKQKEFGSLPTAANAECQRYRSPAVTPGLGIGSIATPLWA
jgi:hypothetical protein